MVAPQDVLRVRMVGGVAWLASAIAVPTRLWLGGVVSAHRDRLLLCTDGLAAYASEAIWGATSSIFR